MPLQILHLIAQLNGYGETRQLRLLVGQQRAAGDQVKVIALSADDQVLAEFQSLSIDCHALQRRWTADPIEAWRLSKILQTIDFDIIHTWGETALNYALALKSQPTRPIISTLFEAPQSTFWNWCRNHWWGQPAQTVVPSHRVKQDCQAQGFPQDQTTIIPLSVAGPSAEIISRDHYRKAVNLPADAQAIAIAGPLVRSKRIDDAIWCYELVRTLEEKTHLLIFGDGPDRYRLERYVRLVSDPAAVTFLGYRNDLLELLPHVDMLWHPGEETTLSSVMLEAMAAGVPVVASDVPVHREVIEDSHTGLLFPIASRAGCARQTQRLLTDPEHRSAITSAAAQWIATGYSPTMAAKAYTDIYRQAISG